METELIEKQEESKFAVWLKKIPKQYKIAFLSTFLIGLLTHMFMFTNILPSWDLIRYSFYYDRSETELGRWFLKFACIITSPFNSPWINGLFSLLYIAITNCFLMYLFRITKTSTAVIVCSIIVSFPVVAVTFVFIFIADGYMLAMLLSTVAVFLVKKFRLGFIYGGIVLGLATAIYQTYFAFGVVLIILLVVFDILDKKLTNRELRRDLLNYLYMILICVAFYAAGLFIAIAVERVTLSNYQGISEVSQFSFNNLFRAFWLCIEKFAKSAIEITGNKTWSYAIVSVIILFSVLIMGIILFMKNKIYKNAFQFIALIGLIAIIPFIMYYYYFLNTETNVYLIMMMPWALLFAACPLLLDRMLPLVRNKIWLKVSAVPVLAIIIFIFNCFTVSNIAYLNLARVHESDYAFITKLSNRIEQHPEFSRDATVAIFGNMYDNPTFNNENEAMRYITYIAGTNTTTFMDGNTHILSALKNIYNYNYNYADSAECTTISETAEFKEMPIWPHKDCIVMIEGILVVKLSE